MAMGRRTEPNDVPNTYKGELMSEQPKMEVPLDEWSNALIDAALLRHAAKCPLADRVSKIETRMASLIGFMIGSGLLGGAVGSIISHMAGGG